MEDERATLGLFIQTVDDERTAWGLFMQTVEDEHATHGLFIQTVEDERATVEDECAPNSHDGEMDVITLHTNCYYAVQSADTMST